MEGWFWRFTDVARQRVTIVLHGRSQAPSGPWSLVAIAREPGEVTWAIGDGLIESGEGWLRVRLPGDTLEQSWTPDRPWPRRSAFGGLGPGQSIPMLGQYWHPHLLRGTTPDGQLVYAEKNWGSVFADDWWWGQAHVEEATVAFAGGRMFGQAPTSLVVALEDRVIRLAPPLAHVLTATAPGRWRIRSGGVTVEAEADPARAHVLPVPVPIERRARLRSHQHLTGRLEVCVRRRGGIVFRGETHLAGLERGTARVPAAP